MLAVLVYVCYGYGGLVWFGWLCKLANALCVGLAYVNVLLGLV